MPSTLLSFTPLSADFTSSANAPVFAVRNGHRILEFADGVDQETFFTMHMPEAFAEEGADVVIMWMAKVVTVGDAFFGASFEGHADLGHDLDSDSFDVEQTLVGAAPGTSGQVRYTTIPFTDLQTDGILPGDEFRVRVRVIGSNILHTIGDIVQILSVRLSQASSGAGGGGGGGGGGGFFTDGAGLNAAIGQGTIPPIANGENSIAQGNNSAATFSNSFALGYNSNANQINTVAIGYYNYATAVHSFASGARCSAIDDDAFAIGYYARAYNNEAFAHGYFASAYGIQSFAHGKFVGAFGAQSTAMGRYTYANTTNCLAIGYQVNVNYAHSSGFGANHAVNSTASISAGLNCDINSGANYSANFGRNNTISAARSHITGDGNTVSGVDGVAFGLSHTVSGARSTGLGSNNSVAGDDALAHGSFVNASLNQQRAWGTNRGGALGNAQGSHVYKYFETTDAIQATMFTLPLDLDKGYSIRVHLVAYNTTTAAEVASFVGNSIIAYRNAGAAVMVTDPTALTRTDSGGGSVNLLADLATSTNDIILRITGEAGQTYEWCAIIEFVEVKG